MGQVSNCTCPHLRLLAAFVKLYLSQLVVILYVNNYKNFCLFKYVFIFLP